MLISPNASARTFGRRKTFIIFCFLFLCTFLYFLPVHQHKEEPVEQLLRRKRFQDDWLQKFDEEYMGDVTNAVIDSLPEFDQYVGNCQPYFTGQPYNLSVSFRARRARRWRFDEAGYFRRRVDKHEEKKCESIVENFAFHERPLSKEEVNYPLAYGMLVYTNPTQVYLTLSAIYQPQNAYCIAIDGKSTDEFKTQIHDLSNCLPNITVIEINNVRWCGREILHGMYECFQNLTESEHPWKYYQYASGFDLPLKTNLEMVRIFKVLNGTTITEVSTSDHVELKKSRTPSLPLWKAGMSALVSRADANYAINNTMVKSTLLHLTKHKYRICADELLWGTIFGNIEEVPSPGAFNASDFREKLLEEKVERLSNPNITIAALNASNSYKGTLEEPFYIERYRIARHQVWETNSAEFCNGKFVHWSCVFGLGDLPSLIRRAEFVGHKFHLDFEPAAYFCLWKEVKDRALRKNEQRRFRGTNYRKLPHYRVLHRDQSVWSMNVFFPK